MKTVSTSSDQDLSSYQGSRNVHLSILIICLKEGEGDRTAIPSVLAKCFFHQKGCADLGTGQSRNGKDIYQDVYWNILAGPGCFPRAQEIRRGVPGCWGAHYGWAICSCSSSVWWACPKWNNGRSDKHLSLIVLLQISSLVQFLTENCCRIFGEEINSLFGEILMTCKRENSSGNTGDILILLESWTQPGKRSVYSAEECC